MHQAACTRGMGHLCYLHRGIDHGGANGSKVCTSAAMRQVDHIVGARWRVTPQPPGG